MDIQNIHTRATSRKKMGYRPADAAGAAGDDDCLAVEAKPIGIMDVIFQSETPLLR